MDARRDDQERYCLFDTAIGPCGLAWHEQDLTRLQLPEADRSATERRLKARSGIPGDPSPQTKCMIAALQRYFAGERVDFSSVALALSGIDPFHRTIYEAARGVGWGKTATYGELARRVGAPEGARAVGKAMARNPVPIIIPCHRILAAGNRIGGFSAYGGALTKERLLALEGVHLNADAPLLPGIVQ